MNPAREKFYRSLFIVSAIYDAVIGVLFVFFRAEVFAALNITEKLPPFGGYLALLGAFVLVIGIAYGLLACGDLRRNKDLVLVGALYKLAYAITAFYYWFAGSLPHLAFGAVFGVADALFFILMAECWFYIGKAVRE